MMEQMQAPPCISDAPLSNIFWEGIPVGIKRAGLPLCCFDPFVAYDASIYIVQIRGRNEENFDTLT